MSYLAMTSEQRSDRFRAIVGKLDGMSRDWQLTAEGGGIYARLIEQNPLEHVLTFDLHADRGDVAFVAEAPDDMLFLVDTVRDLASRLRVYEPSPGKRETSGRREFTTANYAGKLIGDPDFQEYMFAEHGLEPTTDRERIKTRLRTHLRIESLNQLNEEGQAQTAYFKEVRKFEDWNKRRKRA